MHDALFDTNILIDHLNGIPQARLEIDRYPSRAISVITWMEVLAGINDQTEARTRLLLKSFVVIPITPAIAEGAARIRRTLRIKLPDAIVLATAEDSAHVLVTRNSRDFDTIHPFVRIPYRL